MPYNAQVAHEMNRAYCRSIGDSTQPSWEEAPQWQKDSAVVGVQFHLDTPEASPEASHISWLAQKRADGWKYGEVKDAEKKEHPCFLPYDQLPVTQRAKDYIFKQTIESLRAFLPIEVPITERQLTFGEKSVRASFNPSKFPKVDKIKQLAAALIDELDMQRSTVSGEKAALYTLGIRAAEVASMRGVSAATYEL